MEHFWQMIWHETDHVAVIIMLTQLAEGFREKCYKYFPESSESDPMELHFTNEDGEELPATLRVVESSWHDRSMTMMRTIQLSCSEESKVVHHLFFQGWPDYGVPGAEDRSALLELIRLSRDKNLGWENPRIVHCSAGVGRTGSFIAIEHLLAELGTGNLDEMADTEDPIFDTIDALREQRMTMVQSAVQYNFLYDLLAEVARERIKEKATIDKMQGVSTGMLSPGSGEPAHKARRFTRAMKGVFSNIRSRSTSRKPSNQDTAGSEAASSRPVSSSDAELDRSASSGGGKALEERGTGESETQTPEIYHDAAEDWSGQSSPGKIASRESWKELPQKAVQAPEIVESLVESQLPDVSCGVASQESKEETPRRAAQAPEIVESTVESQLPDASGDEEPSH
jgi:Protein-tyrosine phosphatase